MKHIFIIIMLAFTANTHAQTVIKNITNDTVFTETITVEENTIINGNMNTVTFNHNKPKFRVLNGSVLLIKNMKIPNKSNWGTVDSASCGALEWRNVGMIGHISTDNENCNPNIDHNYWLDGLAK